MLRVPHRYLAPSPLARHVPTQHFGYNRRPQQEPAAEVKPSKWSRAATSRRRLTPAAELPDEVDWERDGAVAPVQNQVRSQRGIILSAAPKRSGQNNCPIVASLALELSIVRERQQKPPSSKFRLGRRSSPRSGYPTLAAFRTELLDFSLIFKLSRSSPKIQELACGRRALESSTCLTPHC